MRELNTSPAQDAQHLNIVDYLPNRVIRVYPYVAWRAKGDRTFIANQATSIVAISQDDLKANGVNFAKQDGNGNWYIEAIGLRTKDGRIDKSSPSQPLSLQIKNEEELTVYTNQVKTARRMQPIFCTVDVPFNKAEYENGDQAVFVMGNIIPANELDDNFEDIEMEQASQFKLTNVSVVEQQFNFASVFFDTKAVRKPNYALNVNGKNLYGIKVELEKDLALNRIFAKGKLNNSPNDIDLVSSEKLMPFKMTPISTNGKLSMFADWFDYDLVMPYFVAVKFTKVGGLTLEDLKTIQVGNETFFSANDEEVNVIKDMLTVSYAYATSFANFDRITIPNSVDYGKLDPKQTIGVLKYGDQVGLKVVALEGKDPYKTINGIYETYLRTHPDTYNKTQGKAIKAIMCALSRYIYSDYAIGRGANAFNEAYLPWFIRPETSIKIKTNTIGTGDTAYKNWTLDESAGATKFILDSRYFDISANSIKLKDNVDVSRIRMVQTDRKLTIPFLNDQVVEQNKLPLAGDIDTKSSKDLQYLFYIPVQDDDQFKVAFIENPLIQAGTDATDVHFDTTPTDWGKTFAETYKTEQAIMDFVRADYAKQYLVPIDDKLVFVSSGLPQSLKTEEESIDRRINAYDSIEGAGRSRKFTDDEIKFMKSFGITYSETNTGIQDKTETTLNNEQIITGLSKYFGIDKTMITSSLNTLIVDVQQKAYGEGRYSNAIKYPEITYKLKRQFLGGSTDGLGAIVKTSTRSIDVSLNRNAIFDKTTWSIFVKDVLKLTGTKTYNLVEPNGLEIEEVKEIEIKQIYGNFITLYTGGNQFTIPLFNQFDETIATQKILFT